MIGSISIGVDIMVLWSFYSSGANTSGSRGFLGDSESIFGLV